MTEKNLLLFAEEGAVYHLHGEPQGGYILKMKHFDTDQSVHVPDDWYHFENLPSEINEKIYYYCFVDALKERNFEAAYFYATHVSIYLTRHIYRLWFEDPSLDADFDNYPDMQMIYAQIRSTLTMASLIFDVYSEHDDVRNIYPLKLEFTSRFKRRTRPYALSKIAEPFHFVDNQLSFNLVEIEDPIDYIASRYPVGPIETAVIELIDDLHSDSTEPDFLAHTMVNPPLFDNIHYLEFRKGPTNGDYCLVDGDSIAAGIVQVKQLITPCIFLHLYDCDEESWISVDNYRNIQYSPIWKKFQELLQFCIGPKLGLFFNVSPTNTFVALQ